MIKKERNLKSDAKILLEYAEAECGSKETALPTLDGILMNEHIDDIEGKKQWSWKLAKFIDDLTQYISVDVDVDVEVVVVVVVVSNQ